MRWTGAGSVVLSLLVVTVTRADEGDWKAIDTPRPAPVTPFKPVNGRELPSKLVPVSKPLPASPKVEAREARALDWYSPRKEAPAGSEWTPVQVSPMPAGGVVTTFEAAEIRLRPVADEVPRFEIPKPEVPKLEPLKPEAPKPEPPKAEPKPEPKKLDPLPPVEIPKADPLPAPRPMPGVAPKGEPPPAPSVRLSPTGDGRSYRGIPDTPPPGSVMPGYQHSSADTWGACGSGVVPAGATCSGPNCVDQVPMKCGRFGSAPLAMSRDATFLDLFSFKPLGNDSESYILPEPLPAANRLFVHAEYLLWWVTPHQIPILAATGPAGSNGIVGQPGTSVLLGPGDFGTGSRNGFRVRAGYWFDPCNDRGIDGSFFFLGSKSTSASFDSSTFPTLSRPIFAPNFNQEFAELVASPGLSTGRLTVDAKSTLWGADLNYRPGLCRTCDSERGWFLGYRHVNLKEELTITENILASAGAPQPVGTVITVQDAFKTSNQFHGGQIGWTGTRRAGRWSLDARASVALGVTRQSLEIAGFQNVAVPGQAVQSFSGGLLAAGPNLGTFTKDKFSVVPEGTVTVGYQVTDRLRATVGYNVLYWSNVIRPGDQIDRTVDLSFVPNSGVTRTAAVRPLPTFQQSSLTTQGVQFGVEWKW